jgi:2-polyprenyl-3-methyl-5-hydroxy-6-metoxy-1,4-benzoquinol methylase
MRPAFHTLSRQYTRLRWQVAQWLEIRWWRRYLGSRDKEAYQQWKSAYWRQFLTQIGIAARGRVLDAGCGPAGIFSILSDHSVVALDPLLGQYRQLPHFNPMEYPWVSFRETRLEQFEDAHGFDTVFCLNALNHVQDLARASARLQGLCKAGGLLVVSVDVHRWAVLKYIFRSIPGDALHPHQHSAAEYARLLAGRNCLLLRCITLKKGLVFNYCVFLLEKIQKQA